MPFLRQILEGGSGRPLQHDAHHSGTLAFNNLGFTCNKMQQELQMRQARLQVIIVLVFCSAFIMLCAGVVGCFSVTFRTNALSFVDSKSAPRHTHPTIQPSSHARSTAPQEIFRTARQLWPLSEDKQLADQTTILRSLVADTDTYSVIYLICNVTYLLCFVLFCYSHAFEYLLYV